MQLVLLTLTLDSLVMSGRDYERGVCFQFHYDGGLQGDVVKIPSTARSGAPAENRFAAF